MVEVMTHRERLQAPRRFFGWSVNYLVPHEVEAPAIRQAAADLLRGGTTLGDIAARWNADPTVNTIFGGPWHAQVVEGILRRGTNTKGILDRALHARLVRHLDDTGARRVSREVLRQRRLESVNMEGHYLLTQIGRCSLCGDRVRVSGQGARRGASLAIYRCRAHMQPDHLLRHDGQRHASVPVHKVDAAVIEEMVTVIGRDTWHALDLQEQRLLVDQHLLVTLCPVKSVPRFLVERRG